MRQLTDDERYELVRSRAAFFNDTEFSLDRVELLKASYRSGFISGIDWQAMQNQPKLDAVQAIAEMLKAKCPGCNVAGNPGVTVISTFDAVRHYWGTEKVPCRWCEAVKTFELAGGLQLQAENSQKSR